MHIYSPARHYLDEESLLWWYFNDWLGSSVPANPEQYAISLGFSDVEGFRRALLREYVYTEMTAEKATPIADNHDWASQGALLELEGLGGTAWQHRGSVIGAQVLCQPACIRG